nr:EfeM/EfeO family lipoprotein [Micromonospora sp. AMSO31t]
MWDGPPDPAVADHLLADVTTVHRQLATQTLTALDLANGAKTLLDEVASKKITGEEYRFSHTDPSDRAATVDGCTAIIPGAAPTIDPRDPALGALIGKRAAAVDALVAHHRDAAGRYMDYQRLTPAQVRELSNAINGMAEPVSRLAAAIGRR